MENNYRQKHINKQKTHIAQTRYIIKYNKITKQKLTNTIAIKNKHIHTENDTDTTLNTHTHTNTSS